MNESKWRKFVLSEAVTVKVDDLTFDMIKDTFNDKYQKISGGDRAFYKDAVNFPILGGLKTIIDDKAFQQWKDSTKKYGNFDVIMDPTANTWFDLVKVPALDKDKAEYGKGIGKYYDDKKPGEFTGD